MPPLDLANCFEISVYSVRIYLRKFRTLTVDTTDKEKLNALVTVFRMLHKLLHLIEIVLANDSVSEIAEIDEKYILRVTKGPS